MNAHDQARSALHAWQQQKPKNFYTASPFLRHLLRFYLRDETVDAWEERLETFGRVCAEVIDPAAAENDRIGHHPQLRRWNDLGERTEEIVFHPSYHRAGRPAWESGILTLQEKPGQAMIQAALFFLLSHCGEMGHACPIACTSGLIRALQTRGSQALQKQFLPRLLDSNYDSLAVGAQFITEIQGGSDVGANACTAEPHPDRPGMWYISGEKWFCSVAHADLFLVSARPINAPPGTKGLGAFLVPRRLEDGSLNGFTIRRLKEKFGTRTLPTAEIDFDRALAYQIGEIDEGFKIIIEQVLNVSRWFNAIGSCGLLHRAYLEVETFARHRLAFGHPIREYPLVLEALAEIKTETMAAMASTFFLTHLIDRIDLGKATEDEKAIHRFLVNTNKYATSIAASLALRRAQEILGGNGAVETFSIIPRLYRDSVVYESWEGSHNVLCLQVLRDCQKYHIHRPLLRWITARLETLDTPDLAPYRDTVHHRVQTVERRLNQVLESPPELAQLHIRRVLDELMAAFQAVCLMQHYYRETTHQQTAELAPAIRFWIQKHINPTYDPMEDNDYVRTLRNLLT